MTLDLKYRPQEFRAVIGQDHLVKAMETQIDVNSPDVLRTFLITGPSGCGKTTLARIIARKFESNLDNIVEHNGGVHGGVDDIEKIVEECQYFPHIGKYRIYIIDEAHSLTKQAFQALLKTLEEPPSHVIFILCTTEVEKIPEAIRTRTPPWVVKRVASPILSLYGKMISDAENFGLTKEIIDEVAENSEGSVRTFLNNLAKCRVCTTVEDARNTLLGIKFDEKDPLIKIARLILSRCNVWSQYAPLIKQVPDWSGSREVLMAYIGAATFYNYDLYTAKLLEALSQMPQYPTNKEGPAQIKLLIMRVFGVQ